MTSAPSRRAVDRSPDVSVIMPVWKPDPGWFDIAVSSVLAETACDVELIVIDDGNTALVAATLDHADPRLRVVRIPHGGVSRARNAGVAVARGRHLRFVDADDAVEPGSTAHLLALAQGRSDVVSYGATLFCDEQLRGVWVMRSNVHGDASLPCVLGCFTVRLQAMLFPRQVVDEAGPWDASLTVSEDWEWISRALEHASVEGDDAIVVRYRRAAGASSDAEAGRRGARVVVQRWLDRHPEHRGTSMERRAEGMLAAMAGRVHLRRHEWRFGTIALLRATALDPRAVGAEARQTLAAALSTIRRVARRRLKVESSSPT